MRLALLILLSGCAVCPPGKRPILERRTDRDERVLVGCDDDRFSPWRLPPCDQNPPGPCVER